MADESDSNRRILSPGLRPFGCSRFVVRKDAAVTQNIELTNKISQTSTTQRPIKPYHNRRNKGQRSEYKNKKTIKNNQINRTFPSCFKCARMETLQRIQQTSNNNQKRRRREEIVPIASAVPLPPKMNQATISLRLADE